MQQFQQAIEQQNPLMASLYVARQLQPSTNIARHIAQMEQFIQGASCAVKGLCAAKVKLRRFLQYFFKDLAFSGDSSVAISADHYFLDKVLDYRTGMPVNLAIVMCQIGNAVGLKLQEIAFPAHYLVRATLPDQHYCYINPNNGDIFDNSQLLDLYQNVVDDKAERIPNCALAPISCEETIVGCLHLMKQAFIHLENLPFALYCSGLLLELCPDDPYERRDRGLLLQQLDCLELALKDYHYFISQCPNDPLAELLKRQIHEIACCEQVLH